MSVQDDFWSGITAAIADVRQRVVEEPWFGRVVTDGPAAGGAVEPDPFPTVADGLGGSLRRAHPIDRSPMDAEIALPAPPDFDPSPN